MHICSIRIGRKKTLALLMSIAGVSCFAILFVDLAGDFDLVLYHVPDCKLRYTDSVFIFSHEIALISQKKICLFVDIGKMKELSWLTTLLALLGKSGISGGWAAAQVFTAEVFPTVVRYVMSSYSVRLSDFFYLIYDD